MILKKSNSDIENAGPLIETIETEQNPVDNKYINYARRVDVIYESIMYGMMPLDIAKKYQMKYNTVRSIVNNFKTNNRVNIKMKKCGYTKRKNVIAGVAKSTLNEGMDHDNQLDLGFERGYS